MVMISKFGMANLHSLMEKRRLFIITITLLLTPALVYGHNLTEAKQLIDSGISCDQLTEDQLEAIGDYYMEQAHPGEAHEMMHAMMGGESSPAVKQMHIQMARVMYCNESVDMPTMMSMMGWTSKQASYSGWDVLDVLYVALIVGLVILVYLGIVKVVMDLFKRRRK